MAFVLPADERALLDTHRTWMDEGTERFAADVLRFRDHELREPSALPGWDRAHVIAHVARNADALGNLLVWARTGIETPMYASAEQREADIEEGAAQSLEVLRLDFDDAERRFALAVASLSDQAWSVEVRTRTGRAIPTVEVVWMRCREVWVHACDLGASTTFGDFPTPLVEAILDDLTATFTARPGCDGIELVATDSPRTWTIGPRNNDEVVVQAMSHELLAWLTGRSSGHELHSSSAHTPEIPTWL